MNNLLFHPFGLTHRKVTEKPKCLTMRMEFVQQNQPDLHSNEFINVIKSVLLRLLSGFPTHLWVGTPDQTGPLLSILAH